MKRTFVVTVLCVCLALLCSCEGGFILIHGNNGRRAQNYSLALYKHTGI